MNSAIAGQLIYMFKGDASNLEKTTKSINGGFKGMTKSMLVANLATKAISAGFNLIAQNSDRAIQRIDTFNAFPKVMKNFGVSTQEANASIKRMDKAMRGLPTSLDQAVSGVQNLFMVTKDLPEAERMFKAINDSAMVFANGSTEAIDRFVYAYKQSMSNGKVYAQEFNQMNEAIPGLMDKVAESMGLTFAELKDGLGDGSISMDQFNTALKKLDTEGGAGMESLEKSAKTSTGGIATSIQNAKTAVVRGVSELFKAVDTGLKNAGLGGISEVVSNMGKALESGLKAIAPYVTEFIIKMRDIYNWVKKNQKVIKPLAIAILALVVAFKGLLIINGIITGLSTLAPAITMIVGFVRFAIGVVQGLMVVLKGLWLLITLNPITIIITAIIALIAIFVLLWKKCDWFRNFWIGVWEGIKNTAITAWEILKGVFDTVINFFKNNWKQILLFIANPFAGAFALLYNNCAGFRKFINTFITTIVNWFKAIPGKIKSVANGIINAFKNIPNNLLNVGKNIVKGLWNGISGMKSWVINKVKSMGKSIINGLKDALGIHSPSKEFALIGKFSVLGYTEALDKMRKDVQQQVGETFGISPQLQGTMNAHYTPNINVTNNVDVTTDPLGQTVKKIKTFSGGAKNDYNYGMGV